MSSASLSLQADREDNISQSTEWKHMQRRQKREGSESLAYFISVHQPWRHTLQKVAIDTDGISIITDDSQLKSLWYDQFACLSAEANADDFPSRPPKSSLPSSRARTKTTSKPNSLNSRLSSAHYAPRRLLVVPLRNSRECTL